MGSVDIRRELTSSFSDGSVLRRRPHNCDIGAWNRDEKEVSILALETRSCLSFMKLTRYTETCSNLSMGKFLKNGMRVALM